MWRGQLREEELKVEAHKRAKFEGTARIKLKWLHFPRNQPRELDRKNVERLTAIFQKDCRRLEERHHIVADIDETTLIAAKRLSKVSTRQLLAKDPNGGYPELDFPAGFQLNCLHGQHRIQAAKELLLDWWTVDIYLKGKKSFKASSNTNQTSQKDIDLSVKACLIEEYANEQRPNDGEIYRKIRHYHFQHNLIFERRWWSRLGPHGQRCLKQLLGHEELTVALDDLCAIPGLWGGMRLYTWNTILAMKCDDLIVHYLHRIKDVFTKLLPQGHDAMQFVDEVTVKAIELRAPKVCKRDAETLRGQLLGGTIFSSFSERERTDLWERLKSIDGMIPSLHALFENLNYLKLLMDCVKRLVRLRPGDTVSNALLKAYSGQDAPIQTAESSFGPSLPRGSNGAELGLRQLIAYAMRHYLEMPKESQKKALLARHSTKATPAVLRAFADLAERLGFQSQEITLLRQLPSVDNAREQSESLEPLLVTDGPGIGISRRCGLPSMEEYKMERTCLFINHLHRLDSQNGEGVTSFYVRKSIYSAFFGKPAKQEENQSTRDQDAGSQIDEGVRSELQEYEGRERLEKERLERQTQARQQQEQRKIQIRKRADSIRGREWGFNGGHVLTQTPEPRPQSLGDAGRRASGSGTLSNTDLTIELTPFHGDIEEAYQREAQADAEINMTEVENISQEDEQRIDDIFEVQRDIKTLEEERSLEDQQRNDLDELANMETDEWVLEKEDRKSDQGNGPGGSVNMDGIRSVEGRNLEDSRKAGLDAVDENLGVEISGTSLYGTVYVNVWRFSHGGWVPETRVLASRSGSPQLDELTSNCARQKLRMFTTKYRMLSPRQCLDALIAEDSLTLLLVHESDINTNMLRVAARRDLTMESVLSF